MGQHDQAVATDATRRRFGHLSIVLAVLTAVIVLDQTTKWWGWRHASGACINCGGTAFVEAAVGSWYANPVSGAVLDLLDVGLVTLALSALVRRRPSVTVLVSGSLMLGGWGSNLLDRLGMHYWTAPGSARGAIDFIDFGANVYNVADVFILVGTTAFLVAVSGRRLRAWLATGAPAGATARPIRHPRRPMRMSAGTGGVVLLAVAGLMAVVGIGATNYSGVTAPATPAVTHSATAGMSVSSQ
ncbi:MAG: signal peptidase [Frankiales bacterium]|nr:signal peptidase [Frankiales bacterium]